MSPHKRKTPKPPRGPEREWESPRETAAATGESIQTTYNKIGAGLFDAVKSGSRTLVNVASRRAHYASLPKVQIAAPKSKTAEVRS
jgi:hypothetical protein